MSNYPLGTRDDTNAPYNEIDYKVEIDFTIISDKTEIIEFSSRSGLTIEQQRNIAIEIIQNEYPNDELKFY